MNHSPELRATAVELLKDGYTVRTVATKTGYSESNIYHLRRLHLGLTERPTPFDKFERFETALKDGLTVQQALEDADWPVKPTSAARAYQRHQRPVPTKLTYEVSKAWAERSRQRRIRA